MSHAPPGASWGRRTGGRARDANSTRGRRLGQVVRGRGFGYAVVIGTACAVLAGAWAGITPLIFIGPVAVAAVALGAAFAIADRRAAADFFRGYAAARRLEYLGQSNPLPLTPLLGAGEVRRCEHWMGGHLSGDVGGELGHYRFEARERDARGRVKRRERRRFTICVVDLEEGMEAFPGIFLCRRRGIFGGAIDGRDWLSHTNRHEVELESAKLCDRFDLWVDDGQDELLLRELFAPSFQVLLAEHPLEPCFEYRAGTLVVYVERLLEDEGHLDWLRQVTAEIATRFAAEVAERGAAA